MFKGNTTQAILAVAAGIFLPMGAARGAEFISAETLAKQATVAFRTGDYKHSAKLWEKAVREDRANADYRDGLGKAYEREAEASSFPWILNSKARQSFVQALELDPQHAGALRDLVELNQEPVGLCEGDLNEASGLIDRLSQVDPLAAERERSYWLDAKHESERPGQKVLCGPVKVSRAIGNRVLPNSKLKQPATQQPEEAAMASAHASGETTGSN